MKLRLLSLTLFLMLPIVSLAQTYEIGGFLGGTNFIGDVGETVIIKPNNIAIGGLFRWNRSDRHSFRASFNLARLEGNDLRSGDSRRQNRGFNFSNTVKEIGLGIEFTFWEYDLHKGVPVHTPYIYTGIVGFFYNTPKSSQGFPLTNKNNLTNKFDFGIPIALGYKTSLGRYASLGFEVGARYTFVDDIDGYKEIGNTNFNDWYVFTGINITFAFGRTPCYSKF